MSVYIENSVALADLAVVTKHSVDEVTAEAKSLGIFVGPDWAQRPAVAELDAAGLVTGRLRRERDHSLAWTAHQAEVEQWEQRREAARADAAKTAYDAAVRRGLGNARAAAEGGDAGMDAAREYEKSTPPPTFDGTTLANSWFTHEKKPGLLDRIRESVL
ncbi:MAG: hypothetical protein M3P18_05410 [Actinomycetota bacterium]|nr:hypothetical protein [Actinomycetota bacterium]